ncbi:MAG: hypothetical protein JW913_17675 [Chitinispirillaceae bacterium]|nr:hypothetical protein [Chitinispirillaceae bacterium]
MKLHASLGTSLLALVFLHLSVPAQISRWESRGMGGGGALFYPRVNPHNTDELYITCDMALTFHSTNSGRLWDIIDFRQLKSGTFTNMQFTDDPDIMYVRQFDFEEYNWFPVKSTDGGQTWERLPGSATDNKIIYVYADNKRSDRLIVTTRNEIYFSDNGGTAWKNIYSNTESDGAYISGVFWDGEAIYIGTGGGVLVSEDNGSTFTMAEIPGLPAGDGLVSFTGSKAGTTTRLFCITTSAGSVYPEMTGSNYEGCNGVFRHDYGISSGWESCVEGIPEDRDFLFVDMGENNIDVAYLAGGDQTFGFPSVFKTTDGGRSWKNVFLTEDNENIITGWAGRRGDYDFWWGGTALGFTVCRSDPDIAIVTDYGYPHITTDGGGIWRQMYVAEEDENPAGSLTPKKKSYRGIGMENTSSWDIIWLDSLSMFAGFSDIMTTRSADGGVTWSKNYSGLSTNTICKFVQHPDNGILYATTSSKHEIYTTIGLTDDLDTHTGGIFFSEDGGTTWGTLHDFNRPVCWITVDPDDHNTMYASIVHHETGGIFVSNNINDGAGSAWEKLSAPPRTEGHPYIIRILDDGTILCCYSGRRGDSGFTESSGVFKSSDGGATWEDCGDPGMRFWTQDIVVDCHDPEQNTWYAAVFGGWGGAPNQLGGLYRTTDRGENWTRIYESYQVSSCTNHPTNPDVLYVATNGNGLVYCENITGENPTFTPEATYRYQNPRRIFFNPYNPKEIWVSSGGYGVTCGFEGDMAVRPTVSPTKTKQLSSIRYNQHNGHLTIHLALTEAALREVTIYSVSGQRVQRLNGATQFRKGNNRLDIPLRHPVPGVYFARVIGPGAAESLKFFVY